MTLEVLSAMEVRFIHANGDATDVLKARAAHWLESEDEKMGAWGCDLFNPRSRIAGKVRAADEVEFWVRAAGEGALTRRFVGLVGPIGRDFTKGKFSSYEVSGLSFESKLQFRHVTRAITRATDVGALIHSVMDTNDIGLTLNNVPASYGENVGVGDEDIVFNYTDWHEFLTRLAGIVGAGWHVDANRDLHFYPRGTVSSGLVETGAGVRDFRSVEDSETIVNVLRGFGGTSKVLHQQQATVSSYVTVTPTTTISHRIIWPSEQVALLEVWVRAVAGSAASLEVRIESDNDGDASGVTLARALILAQDINVAAGWQAMFFPTHLIGPGTPIHLIMTGTAPTGVDIGVNGASEPAFRAYVGYPVATEVADAPSIAAHGRREGRPVRDSDITTLEALLLRLNVQLEKFREPIIVAEVDCKDPDWADVNLGETVEFDMPEVAPIVNNRHLVLKEREYTYAPGTIELKARLADGERERETGSLLAALLRRVEYLEASSLRSNSNVLQLLAGSDSSSYSDAAAFTTQAAGTFTYGYAQYGFSEYSPS